MPWKIDRLMPCCAILAAFLSVVPASAAEGPSRCVDASRTGAVVTLAGKLTLVSFAGQRNGEGAVPGSGRACV